MTPTPEHIHAGSGNGEAWVTTHTAAQIAEWLSPARSVMVLTHTKPDGDAVGSSLAVARALAAGGRAVRVAYAGPLPYWLPALAGETAHERVDGTGFAGGDPDAIVIVDTGSWSQLEDVAEWLASRRGRAAVIDHHRTGDADVADRRLIDTEAAATCEPAAEICARLVGAPSPARLPIGIASPLYVGLATDTGWFRHSNLRPGTLRLAASLLEAGANHSALYAMIEQSERPARLRLMARALTSLELHAGDQVASLTLTQKDFHDCHADPSDSGGFADLALIIATVKVAVVFTEAFTPEGKPAVTKVSLRAKEGPGAVDVNKAAQEFGGGGHMRAAGARVRGSLHEIRRSVIAALSRAV